MTALTDAGSSKVKKSEAARPTASVAHDRASFDFTKLGKVVPQSLICCVPIKAAYEHFAFLLHL